MEKGKRKLEKQWIKKKPEEHIPVNCNVWTVFKILIQIK